MNREPKELQGLLYVIGLVLLVIFLLGSGNKPLYWVLGLGGVGGVLILSKSIRQIVFADVSAFFRPIFEDLGMASPAPPSILLPSQVAYDPDFWNISRVYTIKLPRDTEWKSEQVLVLIGKLIQLGRVILRIQGTRDEIVWQLIDVNVSPLEPDEVMRAIRGAYLEAEVSEPEPLEEIEVGGEHWRRVDFYRQGVEFVFPSLRVTEIKKIDPLTGIVNSFVDLNEDEWVSYMLAFGGSDEKLLKLGVESVTKGKWGRVALQTISAALSEGNLGSAVGAAAGTAVGGAVWGNRLPKYEPEVMNVAWEKLNDVPYLRCYVVVEANSPVQARLQHFEFFMTFAQQFSTQFQKLTHTDRPAIQIRDSVTEKRSNAVYVLSHLVRTPVIPLDTRSCVLTPAEIAALWHLPHSGMTASEIAWVRGKRVPAPTEFRGKRDGVLLGVNKPTKAEIYQPLDERTVHTLVIGKTGVGKTSLMHGMVEQDIKAGYGVCVIDPLGGFVRRILQHSIPPEREGDVVILDIDFEFEKEAGRVRYPPALNPLARQPNVDKQKNAGEFAAVLGKLYEDTAQTRWMQTLQAALLTLTAEEQPTLYDIWTVIEDENYRERLLGDFDFSVRRMWKMLEKGGGLSDGSVSSILWRLNEFLQYPLVRACTCHPKRLDIASFISSNKIILVSVQADESVVPKSAQNVLGAIVLSQIQMAALGGSIKQPKTKPFMLYVDEVQNFVTSSLEVIARQARQKGLGLVVATQNVKSIAPKTLRALEGNIGTLVAFECSEEDAENALPMMPSVTKENLMNMGRFKTVISMRSEGGANRAAFSVDPVTAPDMSTDSAAVEREQYLRQKSVENYTPMTYDEVNQWLNGRYNSQTKQNTSDNDNGDFGNPIP